MQVRAVAAVKDRETTIFTASRDKTVKVWEDDGGRLLLVARSVSQRCAHRAAHGAQQQLVAPDHIGRVHPALNNDIFHMTALLFVNVCQGL